MGMGGVLDLHIPVTSMISVIKDYDGDERDVEKVQLIERKMLPWIQEKNQPKSS